jgi:hypothetical protein
VPSVQLLACWCHWLWDGQPAPSVSLTIIACITGCMPELTLPTSQRVDPSHSCSRLCPPVHTCSSVADDAVGSLEAGTPAGGWLPGGTCPSDAGPGDAGPGEGTGAVGVAASDASAVAAGGAALPLGFCSSACASRTRARSLDSMSAAAARSHSCLASCKASSGTLLCQLTMCCRMPLSTVRAAGALQCAQLGLSSQCVSLTSVRRSACNTLPCRSSICRLPGSSCSAAS